jgi:murein DD-endopeptidase MepM/ murein hydrolase activator NlpD
VRLALIGAAVGTALTIPGLAGAGDPRLDFEVRPAAAIVLENGGRRDALLTIEARNPGDRQVRVERFRASYYRQDALVGTVEPATAILTRAGLASDPRVDARSRELWTGLCLAPPSAATDRVRFEFDLVERRGLHKVRATQFLDVPLRAPVDPPVLSLPVSGKWRVTQGHTCDTNHRRGHLGGEFAWDLAAVSDAGHSGAPGFDASHRNEDSATFGQPVRAPLAGRVVAAADGVDDNDEQKEFPHRSLVESAREPLWIFGNYVVLDAGGGVFILLAHLRKDSIAVKPGSDVRQGELVGRAGNSGNTMLPHLHVQVMDGPDPADPSVAGIPALFRDYVEFSASGEGRERDAIYRRVAAGDPPEGSLLLTP